MEGFCDGLIWNYTQTLGSPDPELSACLKHTVLVWIPCGFMWLTSPFLLWSLFQADKPSLPWTWRSVSKIVLCVTLVGDTAAQLIFSVYQRGIGIPVSHAELVYPGLLCISMVNMLMLMLMCKIRGIVTSGVVFLSWLLFAVCGAPEFRTKIVAVATNGAVDGDHLFPAVSFIIYYCSIAIQLILHCFADAPSHESGFVTENSCPESRSSFLAKLTFWWFNGVAFLGWRRDLLKSDLWSLNEKDTSEYLVPRWEERWKAAMGEFRSEHRDRVEYRNAEPGEAKISRKRWIPYSRGAPSIAWNLFLCFKKTFISAAIMKLFSDTLAFANPQILALLIGFIQDPEEELWWGVCFVALFFVNALLSSLFLHQYYHRMFRVGMNIRTVLVSAIFTKSLRLSNGARKKATTGEIVNLMSVDVQRFMDATTYINILWSAPFQIALCLYFLWQTLGPSVLAGVGLLAALVPVNYVIARKQQEYQVTQMENKDKRMKLMNEVLNGIKIIKLYAWEPSFEEKILEIRQKELSVLRSAAYLAAISNFTYICAPFLVAACTFGAYVLIDPVNNILTPAKAFVSLSLFNILQLPMSFLPIMVSFVVQATVSNRRIKDFLNADEIDPGALERDTGDDEAVLILDSTFSWDRAGGAAPTLRGINLKVQRGHLVAVVGQVGSGKSSLLNAILGEMEKEEGSVRVNGAIAYLPQQAWIQNATLRDNVTFGHTFDQVRYDKVLGACALQPDIELLPGGDGTEIGEKGINLSGGQKQRVSLARAVYENADVYLLDDPLSAVDSHVGRHIFDQVLSNEGGLLNGKTRILVTHGLSFLRRVDQIVVMSDGTISEFGSFDELMQRKGAFAEFLESYLREQVSAQRGAGSEEAEDPGVDGSPEQEVLEQVLLELQKVDPEAVQRLETQLIQRMDSRAAGALREAGSQLKPQLSRQLSKNRRPKKEPSLRKEAKPGGAGPGSEKAGTKLIRAEQAETGKVSANVYLMYMRAMGYMSSVAVIGFFAVANGLGVSTNLWLAAWSNDAAQNESEQVSTGIRLGVYAGLGLSQGFFALIGGLVLARVMVLASSSLHKGILCNLLRSPMSFFDTTPLGRIINRCGKDVETVDNNLQATIRSWIINVIQVVSTLVAIIIEIPILAAVIVPLGVLYYFVQQFYIRTSRQLKRIESISRSPIYSHFQETLMGAAVIRASKVEKRFVRESERKVDTNQIAYYPSIVSTRWLSIRLEFLSNCIIVFTALFAVLKRDEATPGLVGVAISYALSFTQILNWAVRMTSDLETSIVAVERIKEYSETPTEAPWESGNKAGPSWPQAGQIVFDKLALKYRPELECVLRGFECRIEGGEKVGIVGRTGAGKSSLTLALFRIVEATDGAVVIDGINIANIGLHELRSRLTIIPQEPVLFSGTLRSNLDPFGRHQDAEIWSALEKAHLKSFAAGLPEKLEYPVSEGGDNLSMGQRQLVSLARALLRRTKILVLDEATASVDLETDELIQKTIRSEFADCTILTIAHRLNTIMDSRRVMVMDQGKIVEYNSPEQLLAKRDSLFFSFAKDAGIVS